MRNKLLAICAFIVMLALTACGTIATPVPNLETLEAQNLQNVVEEPTGVVEVVAVEPTATSVPPTATPVPPTEAPTEPPTEIVTEAPTQVAVVPAIELSAEDQQVLIFIQEFGNVAKGQEIFNTTYEVNTASGLAEWKCATCHLVDSDVAGVGPGLYSLSDRAGGRIPGYPAEVYVYHSIMTPLQYIVSGYPENLMPIGYGEVLSQQDIYDVSAYILSLNK
ncbi:MAG: cytochrome c [Anaerolineae bacterium]|nr:cytochrome c [Anaerolineae bacterium]